MFAVSSLAVSCQTCPSDHFSAIFAATVDQTIDTPTFAVPDPELNFFMNVLKFRYQDIIHFAEDAIYFFNETFGLDFTTSLPPNDQHELFYENAKMSPYMLSATYSVTSNSWLRTGSTRSTCYSMRDGGFQVTFSGEQTLYGSYGGAEGKSIGELEALAYGFYIIYACQQSPILIQFQSHTPYRFEPIDLTVVINLDLYNRVLGYGKAQGIGSILPDPYQPKKYRYSQRNVLTFPTQ